MNRQNMLRGAAWAMALTASTMLVVAPAHASREGRRNTAAALGVLGAYELLKGDTGPGLAAAAGAVYAYKRYRDADRYDDRYRYDRSRSRSRDDRYDRYDGDRRAYREDNRYGRYDTRYDDRDNCRDQDRARNRRDRYDRYDSRYDRYDDRSDRYQQGGKGRTYDGYLDGYQQGGYGKGDYQQGGYQQGGYQQQGYQQQGGSRKSRRHRD